MAPALVLCDAARRRTARRSRLSAMAGQREPRARRSRRRRAARGALLVALRGRLHAAVCGDLRVADAAEQLGQRRRTRVSTAPSWAIKQAAHAAPRPPRGASSPFLADPPFVAFVAGVRVDVLDRCRAATPRSMSNRTEEEKLAVILQLRGHGPRRVGTSWKSSRPSPTTVDFYPLPQHRRRTAARKDAGLGSGVVDRLARGALLAGRHVVTHRPQARQPPVTALKLSRPLDGSPLVTTLDAASDIALDRAAREASSRTRPRPR